MMPLLLAEAVLEQETEATRYFGVLPRIRRHIGIGEASDVPVESFQVYSSVSALGETLIQAVAEQTLPLSETYILFRPEISEQLYQGHGVWETSSSVQFGDGFWEDVRRALYAAIRVRELVHEVSTEAEDLLLRNPALLYAVEAIIPRANAVLLERGWTAEMELATLEDPESPENPVVYLNVSVREPDTSTESFMRAWDELSTLFHQEIRWQGEYEHYNPRQIHRLGSIASLVMTRSMHEEEPDR